jgi:hypothetical protein
MQIQHGLMQGQVLQRDRREKARARITGTCRGSGAVERQVLRNGKPLRGHAWAPVGEACSKQFEALLEDLPVGGPYRVELRVRSGRKVAEQLAVEDIFVGDVWILAGQSNMQGIGNLAHAPRPHSKVRAFYMRDEWDMAEEPVHYLEEAVDIFHNGYGDGPSRPSRRESHKG